MIVVTGATGKLGSQIVDALLTRMPAAELAVSVRDPANAGALTKRGVRVRAGDFANPESLVAAFEGATELLLVSSNARATGGDPLAQHRAAIDAARAAGVRRIVYTSHMAVGAASAFPPMHDHAATETMLRDVGIAWTALRHGFYASTVSTLIGDALETGVLSAPCDGKVSWTAHCDLAAAAATILLEGRFDGPTPPLTASEALDFDDVAAILAELHERPVERRYVTDEAHAAKLAARGVPAPGIEIALGLYRAARVGEFATVNPTLGALLGRPPVTLREVLDSGSDA